MSSKTARPDLTPADMYQPSPRKLDPVSRCVLTNRKAKVVDGWREGDKLVQILRTKGGGLYMGFADADFWDKAFYAVCRGE